MSKKITVIGTDSTHCVAFARLLNNNPNSDWKIKAALRDSRSPLALSQDRYKEIETQMKSLDITIFEHLSSELVSSTDAFIIASVDASLHLEQFKELIQLGKPIFIDKPITYSSQEMNELFKLAEKHQIQVMSSSSLRFSETVLKTKKRLLTLESPIEKITLSGPMPIEIGIPGMFWYGIHLIETLLTLLPLTYEVISVEIKDELLYVICQADKTLVEFKGDLTGQGGVEGEIQTTSEKISFKQSEDTKPLYSYLVEEMLNYFETGKSPVSEEETRAVISLVEKINDKGGWTE